MPMSDQVDPDLAANSQWRQPDSGPPQQEHHKHHLPHLHDDHPDPIMHQPPASALATPGLPTISERLYNQDLAPTNRRTALDRLQHLHAVGQRRAQPGQLRFRLGFVRAGLGGWQILLALGVGAGLLFLLLTFSGFMGHKTGVPFPVMSRISFGVRGAQIPGAIRGGVAIVWFGIQTPWPRWCYGSC